MTQPAPIVEKKHAFLPMATIHFSALESTNVWCADNISTLIKDYGLSASFGVRVSTSNQTAGIGQVLPTSQRTPLSTHRHWVGGTGNIAVSFVLPWKKEKFSMLVHFPKVATVAVSRVLEKFGTTSQIKWVNDVLVEGRKISGVLCTATGCSLQTSNTSPDAIAVIIGVGLNVNSIPNLKSAGLVITDVQPVTSLVAELQRTHAGKDSFNIPSNSDILETLSIEIYNAFYELDIHGFSFFCPYINERLYRRGEEIIVLTGNNSVEKEKSIETQQMMSKEIPITGVLLGICPQSGSLQVQTGTVEIVDIMFGRLV